MSGLYYWVVITEIDISKWTNSKEEYFNFQLFFFGNIEWGCLEIIFQCWASLIFPFKKTHKKTTAVSTLRDKFTFRSLPWGNGETKQKNCELCFFGSTRRLLSQVYSIWFENLIGLRLSTLGDTFFSTHQLLHINWFLSSLIVDISTIFKCGLKEDWMRD